MELETGRKLLKIVFGVVMLSLISIFHADAAQGGGSMKATGDGSFIMGNGSSFCVVCVEDIFDGEGELRDPRLVQNLPPATLQFFVNWKRDIEMQKDNKESMLHTRRTSSRTPGQLLEAHDQFKRDSKAWVDSLRSGALQREFLEKLPGRQKLFNSLQPLLMNFIHLRLALLAFNAHDFDLEKLPDYGRPNEVKQLLGACILGSCFLENKDSLVRESEDYINEVGRFYALSKFFQEANEYYEKLQSGADGANVLDFLQATEKEEKKVIELYKNENFSLSLRRTYYRLFRLIEGNRFLKVVQYLTPSFGPLKEVVASTKFIGNSGELARQVLLLATEVQTLKLNAHNPFFKKNVRGDYECADFLCDLYDQSYQLFLKVTQKMGKSTTVVIDGAEFLLPETLYGDITKVVKKTVEPLPVQQSQVVYDDTELLASLGACAVMPSVKGAKKKTKQKSGQDATVKKKMNAQKGSEGADTDSLFFSEKRMAQAEASASQAVVMRKIVLHDRILAWKRFKKDGDFCSCEGLIRGGYLGQEPRRTALLRKFTEKHRGDKQAAAQEIIENHDVPKTVIDCICNQGDVTPLENGIKRFETLIFKKNGANPIRYYTADVCSDQKKEGSHFIYHALLRQIDPAAFMNRARTSVTEVSEVLYPKELDLKHFSLVGEEEEEWHVQEDATPWAKVINSLNGDTYGVLKKA